MTSMQLNRVSFEEFVGMVEPRLRHALSPRWGETVAVTRPLKRWRTAGSIGLMLG